MVEAEEEYVEQLEVVVSGFLRPMRMAASSKSPPVTHEDVSSIFLNVETVLFLHQIFLKGLTARIEQWPTLVLGIGKCSQGRVMNDYSPPTLLFLLLGVHFVSMCMMSAPNRIKGNGMVVKLSSFPPSVQKHIHSPSPYYNYFSLSIEFLPFQIILSTTPW